MICNCARRQSNFFFFAAFDCTESLVDNEKSQSLFCLQSRPVRATKSTKK